MTPDWKSGLATVCSETSPGTRFQGPGHGFVLQGRPLGVWTCSSVFRDIRISQGRVVKDQIMVLCVGPTAGLWPATVCFRAGFWRRPDSPRHVNSAVVRSAMHGFSLSCYTAHCALSFDILVS